eukprot:11594245-Ditylum_brightwellii.AAC.1
MDNSSSSHLNKHIKYVYSTLRHAMIKSDQCLFAKPLQERLDMSTSSKLAWLEAVCIAEHDFTVLNKRSPQQHTIIELFEAQTTNINPNPNTNITNQATHESIEMNIAAKNWENANDWDGPDLI